MKNNVESAQQLKMVIEYILWSYDQNVHTIENHDVSVIVQDLSNVWMVKIKYIGEVKKGQRYVDPSLNEDDEYRYTDSEFSLLKKESFRQLTKYVEDIAQEISKINLED
jgi:hypothetical protein